MPLFNWDEKAFCGDAPATVCPANPTQEYVTAPHGTSPDGGCVADLISPDHPAMLVSLSDIRSELRSGTVERPIPIDLVQHTNSSLVPSLAFRNHAGQLSIWEPDNNCFDKRVVVDGGKFKLVDDTNSNIFDGACIGTFSDVEYIAGARSFIDCNGNTRVKLVFFPVAELPTLS